MRKDHGVLGNIPPTLYIFKEYPFNFFFSKKALFQTGETKEHNI